MYSTLVEGLCREFTEDSHMVADASVHWLIKKLLGNQDKGKGQSCNVISCVSADSLTPVLSMSAGSLK